MIHTIIFDLGGVLIDWDPRYVYREIFDDEKEMEYFVTEICGKDWNMAQDGGRTIEEGNKALIQQYPQYEKEITTFYERWPEMLGGPIEETVDILKELHAKDGIRIVALTNWSAETFPIARGMYKFLDLFEGILVSGEERLVKPDPAIYELVLSRYNIDRKGAVFIDDNKMNAEAADDVGIEGWHFTTSKDLREKLQSRGVL